MTTEAEGAPSKPVGKADVMRALLDATTALIVEKGLSMSVREIASRAGVNHGLIHTYFGTKENLLTAAFDDIQARAADERDELGFPPADLAGRRDGELARALARVMLEGQADPFSSRRITASWRSALATSAPELTTAEVNERVIVAASLALGYALFADHLAMLVDVSPEDRPGIDTRVAELVAEFGGIPTPDLDD
ncbi:MAG: TetR/AcrR family transcriptional regulator [Acidimicrobiales bacterium]|jgi:AcrR family transcriptional regulator